MTKANRLQFNTCILFAAVIWSGHVADIWKDGAFKNQSQVNTSELSICMLQKKNVGGRGDEAQAQRRHHTVQQFPNNPLQCPPPFRRVPFSLSLPACHLSPPSLALSFLQTSASEQQLAHTSLLPSSPAPSLTPSSFLLYLFFILSQRRANIHLADKRFTSYLFRLISIFFHPSASLTTLQPFGALSQKMCH